MCSILRRAHHPTRLTNQRPSHPKLSQQFRSITADPDEYISLSDFPRCCGADEVLGIEE